VATDPLADPHAAAALIAPASVAAGPEGAAPVAVSPGVLLMRVLLPG
jgi:hypothetical protein